ncbi:MAG: ATP-binding protein [Bacillota bacterium]|nr:ATP-binding protein [Bacillota bacterium]
MVELSLHVLDLIENSVEAGAKTVRVSVRESPDENAIHLSIEDDGKGMDPDLAARVTDPFVTTRTTRKVGLGIPLLKQVAEASGGELRVSSEKGKGTTVVARFCRDHIDRPPLGDMAATIAVALATNPGSRFVYHQEGPGGAFEFDSAAVAEVLGDVPVTDPAVVQWVKQYLRERIEQAQGGGSF